MGLNASVDLWHEIDLGQKQIKVLNLEHPDVESRVVAEIDAGVDVYYDNRWEATESFGRLLYDRPELVAGKSVLIVGAGVGLETVVIGSLCSQLYINDLAPVSIELCLEQLAKNGITNVTAVPGKCQEIAMPPVDLIVGCFVVYERETRRAISELLTRTPLPALLVNEELDAFRELIRSTDRTVDRIPIEDGPTVVLLK